MSDYTPTTEEVRDGYAWFLGGLDNVFDPQGYGDFDRWLARHDAKVAARAWDEGARSRRCHCEAWSAGECACGNYPSEANPYREAGR